MINSFSYQEYMNIINNIKKTGKLKDYSEVDDSTLEFIVLRHDVEFSVERAYNMALYEANKCGLTTSYFFQLRNNSYNTLSKQSLDLIREIYKMGHKIGLHVHLGELNRLDDIEEYISKDIDILQFYSKVPIDRYSFHRPTNEVLFLNLRIDNLINTYSDIFFHHMERIDDKNKLKIKYYADSMHKWKYGYPNEDELEINDRIQLLFHPYSWTKEGYNNYDNFKSLINEKTKSLILTIESECKHFISEERYN